MAGPTITPVDAVLDRACRNANSSEARRFAVKFNALSHEEKREKLLYYMNGDCRHVMGVFGKYELSPSEVSAASNLGDTSLHSAAYTATSLPAVSSLRLAQALQL